MPKDALKYVWKFVDRRYRSHPKDRSVVWLYPDKSGDESSAFLLADGECKRIETQALDKTSKVNLMQW